MTNEIDIVVVIVDVQVDREAVHPVAKPMFGGSLEGLRFRLVGKLYVLLVTHSV